MFEKSEEDFIENLNERREIRSQFAVADKIMKRAKSGRKRKYIDLTLKDKTGDITGRIFPDEDADHIFSTIEKGNIYRVMGMVNEFPHGSGNFNIIVNVIKPLADDEFDLNDFVKNPEKDKDKLIDEITTTIKEIENQNLKDLLKAFFGDDKFTDEFYNAPSAKIHHHNYMGGLLEHTVGVLEICKTASEIFPELDKDLLYTGAILHDVGKLRTYDYDIISIEFSEEGQLLDHLYISCDMVKEKINETKMPDELATQLLHLILSHHGEVRNGWGSPVDPKTPEAVALHHADNLDAKVKGMLQNGP
jgi:3'-5' exoribonuclease